MDHTQQIEQLNERVAALEAHKDSAFIEAFKAISLDMHAASGRPCSTCKLITNIVGWPFGCYELQARIEARKRAGG